MKISANVNLMTTELDNLTYLRKPVIAKGNINFKEE